MTSNFESPDFIRQPLCLSDIVFEAKPARPLGALSDFVCDVLPTAQRDLFMAMTLPPDKATKYALSPRDRALALIDLKMLFVAATRFLRNLLQTHTHGVIAECPPV